ncbi:MAG: NUDIX domain-containing protein [Acidimicrobiia bacterium]
MSADAVDPATEVAIPAATVVLLRNGSRGVETLMLRRDANLEFAGGMWVFPGGRVDPGDYTSGVDPARADDVAALDAARRAAVRETDEEAGLTIEAAMLVWFAHWTPSVGATRRFATWFFAARAPEGAVVIDDGEIRAHEWVAPGDVIGRHRAGEVSLLPPTWMTLTELARGASVDDLLVRLGARPPVHYVTKVARTSDGVTVAMWGGDAGYDDNDPDVRGRRHRLWMRDGDWELELTGT